MKNENFRKNYFMSGSMKKSSAIVIAAAASVMLAAAANAESLYPVEEADFEVYADGYLYDGDVLSVNDTAYVSLREFACMADNAVVWWDDEEAAAHVETDSLELTAYEDGWYIEANGRMLWCEYGVFTEDGVLFVPLSRAAKAFGFDTVYDFEDNATYLTREKSAILPDSEFYDEDDLYWLSRIIHAEAQGEPFLGKVAVGNVIMNRIEADEFPDTVYDVVFDDDNGIQFTPTANGAIDNTPNDDSVIAAKLCLDGAEIDPDILYFLNMEIATNFWIPQNCRFVMAIGDHDFYA